MIAGGKRGKRLGDPAVAGLGALHCLGEPAQPVPGLAQNLISGSLPRPGCPFHLPIDRISASVFPCDARSKPAAAPASASTVG